MPKKKLNHFLVYNKSSNEYDEIKYLTQSKLSEGWSQIMPNYTNKKCFIIVVIINNIKKIFNCFFK